MEGKLKCMFFMIMLVFSTASIAQEYKAKPGKVFEQMDDVCKQFIVESTTDIALIPEILWDGGANWCGYETIACTNCGTSAGSYSILVVGVSKGDDADKIILSAEEFSYIAGQTSTEHINVKYTPE